MAALLPPANAAGIDLPAVPQNPPTFADIGRAVHYVAELYHSMHAQLGPVPATAHELGMAEVYKAALIHALVSPPPWLLGAHVNDIGNRLIAMLAEQPILLTNSNAGNKDPLYDPTSPAMWLQLAAPNPTTRDELFTFTQEQCIAAAAALGLPPLPHTTGVLQRRRQIAVRIGVQV